VFTLVWGMIIPLHALMYANPPDQRSDTELEALVLHRFTGEHNSRFRSLRFEADGSVVLYSPWLRETMETSWKLEASRLVIDLGSIELILNVLPDGTLQDSANPSEVWTRDDQS